MYIPMDGVMFQRRSTYQTAFPNKSHMRNHNKINNHPLTSNPFAECLPSNVQELGILLSYPSYPVPQPPLLPLPAAARCLSGPPTSKRPSNILNRTRDLSLTPKRANSSTQPKRDNKFSHNKPSECAIISSTAPQGQTVAKVLSPGNVVVSNNSAEVNYVCDKFSGSVAFAISPPPSSLPLPRFSLRPKLICKVEAAGVDAGATDNLRRILRLR